MVVENFATAGGIGVSCFLHDTKKMAKEKNVIDVVICFNITIGFKIEIAEDSNGLRLYN